METQKEESGIFQLTNVNSEGSEPLDEYKMEEDQGQRAIQELLETPTESWP